MWRAFLSADKPTPQTGHRSKTLTSRKFLRVFEFSETPHRNLLLPQCWFFVVDVAPNRTIGIAKYLQLGDDESPSYAKMETKGREPPQRDR